MKRHCCTLLLGALAIARVHAGETNGLSMTVQVLAPAQRMVKNTHELLVTITNSSADTVTIGSRGLDYRIMLIDTTDGAVMVPKGYAQADDASGREKAARRFSTESDVTAQIGPHSAWRGLLRLEEEFRGQPIPPGTYWVVVTRRLRGLWSVDIVTAPVVKMPIE